MQISLTSRPDQNPDNIALIELQGDLKSHNVHDDINKKMVGNLYYDNNTPILIIDHHILFGKEVPLRKKFLLIEKSPESSSYHVSAIVTKKVIFQSPPKPIIQKNSN